MTYSYIDKLLRKVVPRKLQTSVKFYHILQNLHRHSDVVDKRILDKNNDPLPWFTYPCIEYLNTLDLSDCRVFEFGSGSSTHYWANKAKSVCSVERDEKWFNDMSGRLPINAKLYFAPDERVYCKQILEEDGLFDLVVIDGAVRYPSMQECLGKLAEDGLIIFDNIEWYPNAASFLRNKGFVQIDFSGFTPLNAFTSCTSIFYKLPTLLQRKKVP